MYDVEGWLKGLGFSFPFLLEGSFNRGDRGGKKGNAWCKVYTSPFKICVAGDWATGEKFKYIENHTYTQEQEAAINRHILKQIEEAEEKRKKDAQTVAEESSVELSKLPAPVNNTYLIKKQIPALGSLKQSGENLLVPTHDETGKIWGYQIIFPDGQKKFRKGQRFKNNYFQIWAGSPTIYICEGYATGATIHLATKSTVICAFSASNIQGVAAIIKKCHPTCTVVIAADNDAFTEGNPGLSTAKSTCEKLGLSYVCPTFVDISTKPTDFNDLMILEGLDEVRKQLLKTEVSVSKEKPKFKRHDLRLMILRKMHGEQVEGWPDFDQKFRVAKDHFGEIRYFQELDNQVLMPVNANAVTMAVSNYYYKKLPHLHHIDFGPNQSQEVAKQFGLDAVKLEETIYHTLEKSTPGFTFRRLDFDFSPGDHPTWDEFLNRLSNAKAFVCFLGSLFDENADRQQYLWLHGEGGEGKSSVTRVLHRILGDALGSENAPSKDDKHWSAGLVGKRLVLFPDCNQYGFTTSSLFKSLTGNDPIRIERKYAHPYTVRLNCKFMFLSNDKPALSGKSSDKRRIIYCETSSTGMVLFENFEEKLWQEAPHFLWMARQAYMDTCPNGAVIPSMTEEVDELVADNEMELEAFCERYLTINPETENYTDCLRVSRLLELMRHYGYKNFHDQKKLLAYIKRSYNIEQKVTKTSGQKSIKVWFPLFEREFVMMNS